MDSLIGAILLLPVRLSSWAYAATQARQRHQTPQEIRGNPLLFFPVSRCRPLVKALEKGRVQPMYAKVREHGAPVQGARLGGKPEKRRTK
jgi:hypothetical protein